VAVSPIDHILSHLQTVQAERAARRADAALQARAHWVRAYQAQRLRHTHADLLADPRTREAALFFLDELYGTQDFVERDAQFAKIVPAIVRLFSAEVSRTVGHLAELHALSERLDTAMARALPSPWPPVLSQAATAYAQAWQTVGEAATRHRQVQLVDTIGQALERYTRHPSLGKALRLMRLPARAANLGALQRFLEAGFDTFARLPEPEHFMRTIVAREQAEVNRLFSSVVR
jgi:hypothetical protein